MKNHLGLWILIILSVISLNLFLSTIQDTLLDKITSQSILFTIAAYLFQMGLNLGMLRVSLNIINTNKARFPEIFSCFHMLIQYVFATIIFLAIMFLAASPGIILFFISISADWNSISSLDWLNNGPLVIPILLMIVPAIYVSIRLQYYDYFLIDEECKAIESILKSANITKEYIGELFLLAVTLSIIVLISIIPLGVGLIISIPFSIMVNTYVFQKLKRATKH